MDKKQRTFRTSNFSTFLFTVLVDGAKPSTNFPREAGREAASREARSAVNSHCGQLRLHRVSNAGMLTPQLYPVVFFKPGSQFCITNLLREATTTSSGKRCFDILEVLFYQAYIIILQDVSRHIILGHTYYIIVYHNRSYIYI